MRDSVTRRNGCDGRFEKRKKFYVQNIWNECKYRETFNETKQQIKHTSYEDIMQTENWFHYKEDNFWRRCRVFVVILFLRQKKTMYKRREKIAVHQTKCDIGCLNVILNNIFVARMCRFIFFTEFFFWCLNYGVGFIAIWLLYEYVS